MEQKLISIIMGIYNCEKTLSEAIESIINQTYTNWELILCDDGSSDSTYSVAESYAEKEPRIALLKNSGNMGLNYTLNKCLTSSKGEYIARMDGDDISNPDRLEVEYLFLEENPEYAIVSCPMIYFDEGGDWGISTQIQTPQKKDFVFHSPVHCHAPCMIRREAIIAVGGYTVNERMLRFEDVNLWYKLYAAGFKGYNLDVPLYKMRDDKNAYHRRSLKSRMNGVYVTYKGFQMFHFAWYMYIFVFIDFVRHAFKGIVPECVYMYCHKMNQQKARKE